MEKYLRVTMPNGIKWDVPVKVIAEHRAKFYASEFDNDEARSLMEDTNPLFEECPYEIIDWAGNNMDWSYVSFSAERVTEDEAPINWQEGWVNGEKTIVWNVY